MHLRLTEPIIITVIQYESRWPSLSVLTPGAGKNSSMTL